MSRRPTPISAAARVVLTCKSCRAPLHAADASSLNLTPCRCHGQRTIVLARRKVGRSFLLA